MNQMIQCVLIAHHLSPGDEDGGAFVCTEYGTARDFKTVEAAQAHIKKYGLNDRHPIWNIFLLTEVPIASNE